jgi:hypothetical protein
LVNSEARNLYGWLNNGISEEEKDKIAKFGISTSSSSNQKYPLQTLMKLCYCNEILERKKGCVPNENQFMVFFST